MKILHKLLLAVGLTAMMLACADDDSFSTSPGKLLTFSTDSVRMDTLFTRVPSSTRSFWVYNRSGSGIRCSQVRLEKGNQTGFRVNVDGTYLSPSAGFQMPNLEIRDGDSIRVFVELTAPANGTDDFRMLNDDLVFALESGVEQKMPLTACTWDAEVVQDVVISRDEVWQGSVPTVVYGDIRIEEGATLTIMDGKTLYFHGRAGIDVYGRLVTDGTAEHNITLRGDRLDRMFDYLPYDQISGQWGGIRIHESSYDNVFNYTDIHSTFDGIVCDSADISRDKLVLNRSTIHNCQGTGLKATNCRLFLYNSLISNTLGACVEVSGGNVVLQHSTLAQFYPFDANRGPALWFGNGEGRPLNITCLNTLVTGYAEDVVTGAKADVEDAFDYYFFSSILRTPKVFLEEKPQEADTIHFRNVVFENPEDTVGTGERHFRLVDIDMQRYDFHLTERSVAVNAGSELTALPTDRDGNPRDERPDIGCFEYITNEQYHGKSKD